MNAESPDKKRLSEAVARETLVLRRFQSKADDISRLILNTDLPWIDIVIQAEKLRQEAEQLFPGKGYLFDLIYESRFKRLWEQWRQPMEESSHDGNRNWGGEALF